MIFIFVVAFNSMSELVLCDGMHVCVCVCLFCNTINFVIFLLLLLVLQFIEFEVNFAVVAILSLCLSICLPVVLFVLLMSLMLQFCCIIKLNYCILIINAFCHSSGSSSSLCHLQRLFLFPFFNINFLFRFLNF